MISSFESVVSTKPFTVRRVVRWMDCDPAGYVFTGLVPGYLLSAVDLFFRHIHWSTTEKADRLGLPCKHLSLTFDISLEPESVIDLIVQVEDIRTRTFDLVARALTSDGRVAFEGKFSPICIKPDARESIAIPRDLREALEHHSVLGEGKTL